MKLFFRRALITMILPLLSLSTWAQDPVRKGYSIAERSDRNDLGFGDSVASLTMTLHNAQGHRSERTLVIRTLERASDKVGDKTVVLMRSPADVKGTAFLSHAELIKADGQWIFLPALKRVKRIASVNKSGPFLGSEFSYEDFTSQELGKYQFTYLREEILDERTCDVLERIPLYPHSGYSRQVAWIDQKDAQYRKIEFFNKAGHHVKTLIFSKYRRYLNSYWRAHQLDMTNHRNGKSTILSFDSFEFSKGLSPHDFAKSSLPRLR